MTANALTIDLEDWQQMLSRRLTGRYSEPSHATVEATHLLLDKLDELNVRATFFVVGMLAERYPDLVREVHRRGHEIGSHTYTHRPIYTLSRDDFREEMRRSVQQLGDLTGQPIIGFRAPEFSVGKLGHWCFEVLAELGFRYDSSVFPVAGIRYGIPDAPRNPFRMKTPAGELWEFPLATWKWWGRQIPFAGGSYYRLLPESAIRRAIREADGSVFYFHPYEFHRGVLRLENGSLFALLKPAYLKYRVLHNFRTARILRVLEPILKELEFRPLREVCASLS
jgi:polysaccharide deacetylase family protein (PEP-CTERM system associated)